MKVTLLGGTLGVMLVATVAGYMLVDSSNTQALRDKVSVSASGVVATMKAKEQDLDKLTEDYKYSTLQSVYQSASLLGRVWSTNYQAVNNDILLLESKTYGFNNITIYEFKEEGVTGVLSTQPNKVGDDLTSKKEILEFVLKAYNGETDFLSETLMTHKTSITSDIVQKDETLVSTVYTYIPELERVIAIETPIDGLTQYFATNGSLATIAELKKELPALVEIGVVDISKDSDKKGGVLDGTFKYSSTADTDFFEQADLEKNPTKTYVAQVGEKQLFKHFSVIDEERAIYVGMDYTSLQNTKQGSHTIIAILIILSLLGVGVLEFLHLKKSDAYLERITKRLVSLKKGKTKLKTIDLTKDEYRDVIEQLNELTDEVNYRKKATKEQLERINNIITIISENKVRSAQDLAELRLELRSILNDLTVITKTGE